MNRFPRFLLIASLILAVMAATWNFKLDIDQALETARRESEAIAKDVSGDLKFIANLSLLRNSIHYSSMATIERVLRDYIDASSRPAAALIFDTNKKTVVNGLSNLPSIPTLELLTVKDLDRLKAITDRGSNLSLSSHPIQGMEGYLLILYYSLPEKISLKPQLYSVSSTLQLPDRTVHFSLAREYQISILATALVNSLLLLLVYVLLIFGFTRFLTRNVISAYQVLENKLCRMAEGHPESTSSNLRFPFRSLGKRIDQAAQRMQLQQEKEKELLKQAAIAGTVGMVAHDIRKPLSLAKVAIDLLKSAPFPAEQENIVRAVEVEINLATKSAEAMLADIMAYNAEMNLSREDISIVSLIERAFTETANWFGKPFEIPIESNFLHTHLLYCDGEKVLRTLSNIILNACQAMPKRMRGTLWIKTSEDDGQMEIILGNSGSCIPSDIVERIFEANFTHGKKKGTGLGLAIAKKTIETHGGTISVSSDTEREIVEFRIVLGVSSKPDTAPRTIHSTLAPYHLQSGKDSASSSQSAQVERIREFADQKSAKISIAVLDDEKIFRQTVKSLLDNSDIKDITELSEFSSPESLLSADLRSLDFLISDVDLEASMDGYDVVRSIRQDKGLTELPICISSNKALNADYKQAIDAGATTFLPKPMTIDHLLKFLNDSLANRR